MLNMVKMTAFSTRVILYPGMTKPGSVAGQKDEKKMNPNSFRNRNRREFIDAKRRYEEYLGIAPKVRRVPELDTEFIETKIRFSSNIAAKNATEVNSDFDRSTEPDLSTLEIKSRRSCCLICGWSLSLNGTCQNSVCMWLNEKIYTPDGKVVYPNRRISHEH